MSAPQDFTRRGTRTREQPTGAVPWREVAVFLVVATGLCTLIALVFRLGGPDALFGLPPGLPAMLTPTVAVLVVVGLVSRPRSVLRATSLRPSRPRGRTAAYCLVALLLSTSVGAVVALVAGALDVQELDLENFSMLRQRMAQALGGFAGEQGSGFPPALPFLGWLLLQLGSVLSVLVFAFGEEYGWRGYLLPKLLPTGIWPMLLLSGVIWTAWHAPLILLRDFAGPGDFAAYCTLFLVGRALPQVVVISWLRLASGSVWAAVVFHASSVMIFTGVTVLSEAGSALNPAVSLMGRDVPLNWFVMAAVAVLLAATGRLRARPGDPALSETAPR